MSSQNPGAPTGFGPRAEAFWTDVTTTWELRRDEIELLTEICRQLDVIDALDDALSAEGVTSIGSRGQLRVNPVVPALNATRALLARMVGQLGLPDGAGAALPTPASSQARKAAQARWRDHTPRGRSGAA